MPDSVDIPAPVSATVRSASRIQDAMVSSLFESTSRSMELKNNHVTFSIAACDLEKGEWGIAVASKFLAVGSAVPWAKAKVGAVATQAMANLTFGPNGLNLLEQRKSAQETLEELTASDEGRDHRQVGVVDGEGRAATFTGGSCIDWAGGVAGDGFAIQGNILTGADVVESMREAYLGSTGRLVDRLMESLLAGDRAGGDRRGRQSAAVLVVRESGGYGGANDRAMDLRVDDHPDPVVELKRLVSLHSIYFEPPKPEEILQIDGALASEIRRVMKKLGAFDGADSGEYDEATSGALKTLMGIENLEMKWLDGNRIDARVLQLLKSKAGA